jgi:hypothetical protein
VTTTKRSLFALIAAAGCLAALPTVTPAAASRSAETNTFKKLVEDKAPALVSIKFIMKGERAEREEEATGVIVEPTGLIITSNNAFAGVRTRSGREAGAPSDIKVLVGDDTQGVKAKIIARDTELGLAWVQTDNAPAKPYPFIDFSSASEAQIGDSLFMVSLMGKFFDRAPMIAEAYVGAVVKKPRNLIIPSIGLAGSRFGLPVFDSSGKAVGISTLVRPDQEDLESGDPRATLRGLPAGMILPARDVVEATARAKENAKKNLPADTAEEKKTDAGADKSKTEEMRKDTKQ